MAEVVLPTYVQYTGKIRAEGEWATVPGKLATHLHVARTVIPSQLIEVPIRVVNVGDAPLPLKKAP